jgi:hypothetical protein
MEGSNRCVIHIARSCWLSWHSGFTWPLQTHWWMQAHAAQTEAAIATLKTRYPTLPVGYPEGADTLHASYEHLLINWLELDAVRRVLGQVEAQRIAKFWSHDHYTKLYQAVGADGDAIKAVAQENGLLH